MGFILVGFGIPRTMNKEHEEAFSARKARLAPGDKDCRTAEKYVLMENSPQFFLRLR